MELILLIGLGILVTAFVRLWRSRLPQTPVGPAGIPSKAALRYTRHVRERMRERRIDGAEVETTLRHPDRIAQNDDNASVKFEKDYDDRTLKVWIAQDPQTSWTHANEVIIKSAAWRYTAVIPIEYDAAGRLIGKKGATIKAICSRSGASVRVEDGLVTISGGERYEVERAKQLVAEALKTRRTNSNCRH